MGAIIVMSTEIPLLTALGKWLEHKKELFNSLTAESMKTFLMGNCQILFKMIYRKVYWTQGTNVLLLTHDVYVPCVQHCCQSDNMYVFSECSECICNITVFCYALYLGLEITTANAYMFTITFLHFLGTIFFHILGVI